VRPFVLYSARHTCLIRLGEANADCFAVQRIAGHSSITISQRYIHPSDAKLEAAFTALEAFNQKKNEKLAKEQGNAAVQ
jgi:integrase